MPEDLPPTKPAPTKDYEPVSVIMSLKLVGELGYIIALPAIVFCFAGAYLDKYLHTSPIFFLIAIAIALALSTIGIIRKIKDIAKSEF